MTATRGPRRTVAPDQALRRALEPTVRDRLVASRSSAKLLTKGPLSPSSGRDSPRLSAAATNRVPDRATNRGTSNRTTTDRATNRVANRATNRVTTVVKKRKASRPPTIERRAVVHVRDGEPVNQPNAALPSRRRRNPSGGAAAAPWMRSNTQRLRVVTVAWGLIFTLVFARMAFMQLRNPRALDQANRQLIRETRIAAERGDLVDRSGIPLAMSVREWRLVADPIKIQKAKLVDAHAAAIGQRLGVDSSVIKARLLVNRHFAIVARGLSEPMANVFRAKSVRLDFVGVEEEPRRLYPAGDLARGVLGSVRRIDQVGQTGFELKYEDTLKGVPGEMKVERDRKGGQIPGNRGVNQPPKRGASFQLTIDRALQFEVEGLLAQAIALTGSENGVVMVSEVATGEILAVANMSVDSNRNVVNTGRNSAFVSAYELGSVNKAVTMAAALEERVVTPTSKLAVPDHLTVWDKTFKDDVPHPTMAWTPGEILTASSNIGTIKIAKMLGKQRLNAYLRKFGMGEQTAVAFPGESAGILPKPAKWSGTSIGTISIGQGIAMTSAQMIDVYNTIANGGEHVPLKLVKATIDADGKSHPVDSGPTERVVSETTASELTTMLVDVVANGTGTAAAIPGYTVAGKTGTAQKPDKTGYSKTRYVASFAGFFPAEKPVLSAIVVLDEPKTSIYGGHIAAPLFSEVGRIAASTYRVPPSPGRQLTVKRDVSPAEGSLAWQRALLRRGALSLAPSTPGEIGQDRLGMVTRSDLPEGTFSTIETSTTAPPTISPNAVTDPLNNQNTIDATNEAAGAGGIVYFDSESESLVESGGVPATIAPSSQSSTSQSSTSQSSTSQSSTSQSSAGAVPFDANPMAPATPALASTSPRIPIRYGIPDLSPQSASPRIRPRALATPMTLRAGATEHNGVAKQSTADPTTSATTIVPADKSKSDSQSQSKDNAKANAKDKGKSQGKSQGKGTSNPANKPATKPAAP